MKLSAAVPRTCRRIFEIAVLAALTYSCTHTATLFQRQSAIPLSELSALDYYLKLKSLPASGVDRMHQELKQKSAIDPVIRLVQTAMLLSVPEDATPGQEQLALESLVQAINSQDADTGREAAGYREFALLWHDVLRRRQELKRITGDLNNELTAERKKVLQLQQEVQGLVKKINALKSIEEKIDNRIQLLEPAQ
jgi:hypothetical protein